MSTRTTGALVVARRRARRGLWEFARSLSSASTLKHQIIVALKRPPGRMERSDDAPNQDAPQAGRSCHEDRLWHAESLHGL